MGSTAYLLARRRARFLRVAGIACRLLLLAGIFCAGYYMGKTRGFGAGMINAGAGVDFCAENGANGYEISAAGVRCLYE